MRYKTLLSTFCVLLLVLTIACGRRGDPVLVVPYQQIPAVHDLKAFKEGDNVYLRWGMPEDKAFPLKALKGFVIFRTEVPEGINLKDCECEYRMLDFIMPDSQTEQSQAASSMDRIASKYTESGRTFRYVDKNIRAGISYAYKVVVMDKNSKMSTDSNPVFIKGPQPETEKIAVIPTKAPEGLKAIYTQKNIVLTWDEVIGQEIKFYRVYRSEGTGFIIAGEVVTPAFTDKNIESSKKYYYKVSAVGESEGSPSLELGIVTEVR